MPNIKVGVIARLFHSLSAQHFNGRQIASCVMAVQGTVNDLWNISVIPIGHVSPECIETYPKSIVALGIS